MPGFDTVVIGAGPVGLTTALLAARCGTVLMCVPRTHAARHRVDSVPVSLLAVFLELGLHPAELGAAMVHDRRLIAWSNAVPVASGSVSSVHILRPCLDQALLAKVRSHRRITIQIGRPPAGAAPWARIFDATGRRALSAERIVAPADPAICRSILQRGTFAPAQQALRIASLPGGYAYRLATAGVMTIGLVLARSRWHKTEGSIEARIRQGGGGWLLAGLPALENAASGQGGSASVQWSVGGTTATRLGDAYFARDALAGQGIATGVSAAFRAMGEAGSAARPDLGGDRRRHLQALHDIILTCRYADEPFWRTYRTFLTAGLSGQGFETGHLVEAIDV